MSDSDEEGNLLGRIAVRMGFVTLEQLAEATRERGRVNKKLGAIMLERGMINEENLGRVLALQKRHYDGERKKAEPAPARARIATPQDWRPEPEGRTAAAAAAAQQPRRERRTADVVRERLDGPTPVTRRVDPRALAARPEPAPTPAVQAPAPQVRARTQPSVPSVEARTIEGEVPRAARPTAPEPPPVEVVSVSAEPAVAIDGLEPLPWDAPAPTRVVEFLHRILEHAVASHASDVHLHSGALAKMRQYGQLAPITQEPLGPRALGNALMDILTPWQRRRFEELGEIDMAYAVDGIGRFRVNVYQQQHGVNGVFHVIPGEPPTLASLGLPASLAKLTNYTQGLILLTGPTGSGKTSTLAALANIINHERSDHILTIEDPIEYVFSSRRCIVNQRQVGRHTESFASGLRGALREDPDVICIGELRDLETISLALSAAETGHLVLATMHTGSAVGTVNRVVGAFPPSQQPQVRAMMSESLRAVTSQRLLPSASGSGVVPALEVLYVTRPVAALIRDNKSFQIASVMQTGKSQGMQLLDESLRELVTSRRVQRDVALLHCEDRRKLEGP